MRGRTPRHDRIGTQPRSETRRTPGGLAASFGFALLIPVVLWAVANPALAGGAIVAVLGIGLLARLGVGVARRRRRTTRRDPAFRGAD